MNSNFPPSLSGYGITLVSPPPAKFDRDVASLCSNEVAMEHLSFMTKQSSGGWSEEDAAQRRNIQERSYAAGEGFNCIILRKLQVSSVKPENDGLGDQCGLSEECVDSDDEAFSGVCGFRQIDWWNRSAEMGIILHPDCFRQRVSCKAHILCLKFGFEDLGLNRIEFRTAASNTGMVLFCREVMGATHEGTLRDFFPLPVSSFNAVKGFAHVDIFSILQSEWPAVKERLLAKLFC